MIMKAHYFEGSALIRWVWRLKIIMMRGWPIQFPKFPVPHKLKIKAFVLPTPASLLLQNGCATRFGETVFPISGDVSNKSMVGN